MNIEIGSEFWAFPGVHASAPDMLSAAASHCRYYVSGRTALLAILDDICRSKNCKRALLPSYCCYAIIEPFVRKGIDVRFYPVTIHNGHLQSTIHADGAFDIVLLMNYFGYTPQAAAYEIPPQATVIYDATHSLLCSEPSVARADYAFASFRKWAAIPGAAIAWKTDGAFVTEPPILEHRQYIALRNRAVMQKRQYMCGRLEEKDGYLDTFAKAESRLDADYADYAADARSLAYARHLGQTRQARRQNARTLLDQMVSLRIVRPLFPVLTEGSVPLFVPIFVQGHLRDPLREYLVANRVYSPIHWPVSSLHRLTSDEREIYDHALSLVCDQRHDEEDMLREIQVIKEFEQKHA